MTFFLILANKNMKSLVSKYSSGEVDEKEFIIRRQKNFRHYGFCLFLNILPFLCFIGGMIFSFKLLYL